MPRDFDPSLIKKDFPVFEKVTPYGKPLIYLDSGATAQRPATVIEAMAEFSTISYANVHRGIYSLANDATLAFEKARQKIQAFIHAEKAEEIIFTSGGTDGFNLIAHSLGKSLQAGDEIILSKAEHHSNIVPWDYLRQEKGCIIRWLDITPSGEIDLDQLDSFLSEKTKIVSITHMSNVLGTVNPIAEISKKVHQYGAYLIVDGCQSIVHLPVDVQALDVDFYVTTGHKLYGPSGIGFVYGKYAILEKMPPYRGGGEMIDQVTLDHVTYNTPPHRFEAGTPPIVSAVGLGYAIDYLNDFSINDRITHEKYLTDYAHTALKAVDGVTIYGTSATKMGVISFSIKDLHPHDFSSYADRYGICLRAGHHCCQPLMEHLKVQATLRVSLGIYNTQEDIDILVDILQKAKAFFAF